MRKCSVINLVTGFYYISKHLISVQGEILICITLEDKFISLSILKITHTSWKSKKTWKIWKIHRIIKIKNFIFPSHLCLNIVYIFLII